VFGVKYYSYAGFLPAISHVAAVFLGMMIWNFGHGEVSRPIRLPAKAAILTFPAAVPPEVGMMKRGARVVVVARHPMTGAARCLVAAREALVMGTTPRVTLAMEWALARHILSLRSRRLVGELSVAWKKSVEGLTDCEHEPRVVYGEEQD
jgi:hypothetical protein